VDVILPTLDPVWKNVIRTSIDVGSTDRFGRDWEIHKTFMGSYAGVIDQGRPYAELPLAGDDTDRLGERSFFQNTVQMWPDPLEGPNPYPNRFSCPLRSQMANIALTLGEAQAEANPGLVGSIVAPKLLGFARNIAHYFCNYWYLSQALDYRISTIVNPSAEAAITGGFGFWFTPGNLAIDRYAIGQRVDIWDAAGAVRRNLDTVDTIAGLRVNVIVTAVDEVGCRVQLGYTPAAATWVPVAYVPTEGDIVTFANTSHAAGAFTGTAGMNSFLKFGDNNAGVTDANTLLGATESIATGRINVNTHPTFRSVLRSINGPLTRHVLLQSLALFNASKRKYGYYLDMGILSPGVLLEYLSQLTGRERFDITNRLTNLQHEGLEDGMRFFYDGRWYELHTSSYVEANTVYFIRQQNNFKMYNPPEPSMLNDAGGVLPESPGAPIKFVAPFLTGTSSNRIPILRTCIPNQGEKSGEVTCRNAGVTEATQMPAWIRFQLLPDKQIPGMKLINVTEDRVWGETGLGVSD